jgi:beta-glucanase (GH16 family)
LIKKIIIYLYTTIHPDDILRLTFVFRPMNKIQFFNFFAASCFIILMTFCTKIKQPYDLIDGHTFLQKSERRNDSTSWELVWEDEFDVVTLDTSHWTKIGLYTSERLMGNFPKVKTDKNAWKEITNHWASYMSATDAQALEIKDGNILLKAIVNKDTTQWDNRPYHTGGIWTLNKFAFQYGRIEVRAKLDPAYGAWPAIWMIPEKKIYKDQHNGELDIMERLNHDDFVYQTVHSHWNLKLKLETPKRYTTAKINPSDYNVYSVEWYPTKIKFAVNGEVSFVYSKLQGGGTFQWPFDQPFYLIVDNQLEGWPGKVTHPEELPIDMTVDWVRLYQ